MRVLVTGGAGFLGSILCDRLVRENHEVICLDNLSTGRMINIEKLLSERNFRFLEHDVCDPINLKVDKIFNFASPASPVHYQRDPVQTLKTNVLGTLNMLELARRTGATFLQASTSEIYGDPEIHPQHEEYFGRVNPIGIRSCYDEGKRCAETLAFDYSRHYLTNIKVVRIFNTYGPKMSPNDGRVIPNFIQQALQNSDLTVYGDGMQSRSLCFVEDLIDGIILFMNDKSGFKGPLNIGNPEEITMLQLADLVIKLTNSESKIKFESLPLDDPRKRKPDISKAIDVLNWKPQVTIESGLKKTIQYFRQQMELNSFKHLKAD